MTFSLRALWENAAALVSLWIPDQLGVIDAPILPGALLYFIRNALGLFQRAQPGLSPRSFSALRLLSSAAHATLPYFLVCLEINLPPFFLLPAKAPVGIGKAKKTAGAG